MLKAVVVGVERAVAVAARGGDVAYSIIAHRQIPLPFGVAGIAGGERLSNLEAVVVGLERAVAVAARGGDVAYSIIAHGQIPLPFGVAGIAGGERLSQSRGHP